MSPNDPQAPRSWHLPLLRLFFLAAALLLVGAPLWAKERPSETFYYLAVPTYPAEHFLSPLTIQQLDRHGVPVLPREKAAPTPFFKIWRSGFWTEKPPEVYPKNQAEWRRLRDQRLQRARQTVEAEKGIAGLPSPIVQFFAEIEALRASAQDCEIILQPLYPTFSSNDAHWNLLATPSSLSAKERTGELLRALHAPKSEEAQDPAQQMQTCLVNLGVKVQSTRYWPEYNVFLFEGDAQFGELVDVLFNSIAMDRSRLPAGPVCVMLSRL